MTYLANSETISLPARSVEPKPPITATLGTSSLAVFEFPVRA